MVMLVLIHVMVYVLNYRNIHLGHVGVLSIPTLNSFNYYVADDDASTISRTTKVTTTTIIRVRQQ